MEGESFSLEISGVAVIFSKTSSVVGILLAPTIYIPYTYNPKKKISPHINFTNTPKENMKTFITLN